jgi:hypothetical protein
VPPAASIVLVVVGALLALSMVGSAVRYTILPRGVPVRVSRYLDEGLRLMFRIWAGRSASFERRDRVMALFGPVYLLVLLMTWLAVIFGGFILMFLAVATNSVTRAVELSGSSMFTLGTTGGGSLGPDLITYAEAAMGLLMVTLLITYLPSIYAAFSRRERGVALMRVRAGRPPRPTTILIRYHRIEGGHMRLTELWNTWESWFVDVEESHLTFPVLAFFRSPEPSNSWIVAAGTLLDAASLWLAAVEHPLDPEAQLCVRAGYVALRQIAGFFHIPYDPDPAPGDPISIGREEFNEALTDMEQAGLKLLPDREKAWRDYAGWRVNYDTVLLNLARMVEAPPAPWVSDRSPLMQRQRWWVTASRRWSNRRPRR